MIPLQSHEIYEEHWIPTGGRFWSLTQSDESWARYFGLGEIIREKAAYYDVRDWEDNLLGYTRWNPIKYECERHVQIPIHTSRPLLPRPMDGTRMEAGPETFTVVAIMVNQLCINEHRFLTWTVRALDVEALLRGGWMTSLGEDNIDNYAHKLWEREMRKNHGW